MTDVINEGTSTGWSLAVGQTRNGTSQQIDAEPRDPQNASNDGKGGKIDKDWYRVELVSGRTYEFSASASSALGEVFIRLYNASGNPVGGSTEDEGRTARFTYSGPSGIYYLAISAGGPNGVWETATGSYSVSLTDVTPAGQPDLEITRLEVDGQVIAPGSTIAKAITPGGTFQASVDITNTGDGDAGSSTAGAFISINGTATELATNSTGSLSAGRTNPDEGFTLQIPLNLPDGTYAFAISADFRRQVSESDEGNNGVGFGVRILDDYSDLLGDTNSVFGIANLAFGGSLSGVIGAADNNDEDAFGDRDTFRIAVVGGNSYTVTVNGSEGLNNAIFSIRDANFDRIDVTSNEGPTATLTFVAQETDTYFVRVGTGVAGQYGRYTVSIVDNGTTVNAPPEVNVIASSAYAAGTILTGEQLIQVTDPQGASDIADILIYDAFNATGAEWRFNGSLIDPGGSSNPAVIPYNQLSLLTYTVGTGSDNFAFEARDQAGEISAEASHTITATEPAGNSRPQITGPGSLSFAAGSANAFGSLFSVTDPDGAGDVARIIISDLSAGGGKLTLNGNPISGDSVTISPSSLSSIGFLTGMDGSRDTVTITAVDRANTATAVAVSITAASISPGVPVISGPSALQLEPGSSLRVADYLSPSDPNGPSDILRIILHDETPGTDGGAFWLGATRLAAGTHSLTLSEFNQLSYRGGSAEGSNSAVFEIIDRSGLRSERKFEFLVAQPAGLGSDFPDSSAFSDNEIVDKILEDSSRALQIFEAVVTALRAYQVTNFIPELPGNPWAFGFSRKISETKTAVFSLLDPYVVKIKEVDAAGNVKTVTESLDVFRAKSAGKQFFDSALKHSAGWLDAAIGVKNVYDGISAQDPEKAAKGLTDLAASVAGTWLTGAAVGLTATGLTIGGSSALVVGTSVLAVGLLGLGLTEYILKPVAGYFFEEEAEEFFDLLINPDLYLGPVYAADLPSGISLISEGQFIHHIDDRTAQSTTPYLIRVDDTAEGKSANLELTDALIEQVIINAGSADSSPGLNRFGLLPLSVSLANPTLSTSDRFDLSNFAELDIKGPNRNVFWGIEDTSQTTLAPNTIYLDLGAMVDTVDASGADKRVVASLGGGSDTFVGGAGNDQVFGERGHDTIDGGTGDDLMVGGLGNDTYFIDSIFDVVTELAGEGTDRLNTSINLNPFGNRYANIEVFGLIGSAVAIHTTDNGETIYANEALGSRIFAYGGADTIFGAIGHDRIFGGAGDDTIFGAGGNDRIDGGAGIDTMYGGSGNDNYFVDNAGDVVIEFADEGTDFVRSFVDFTLGDNIEYLRLALNGTVGNGNALDNIIVTAGGAAILRGYDGDDRIRGSQFDDILVGGRGNDTINGRAGGDLIEGGGGDDELNGSHGNDVINGGFGNDTIYGGRDDDTISGGSGRDTMRGDSGADRFVFDDGHFAGMSEADADRIVDFDQAENDLIDLSLVDAITGGDDDAFTFIAEAAFSGNAGEVRFEQSGGMTMVYMDVDGDMKADYAIALTGLIDLTEADFIL